MKEASMVDTTTRAIPARAPRILPAALAWLGASIAVAASGVMPRLPIVAALWLVGSVAGWTIAYRRSAALRRALAAIDLRAVIALHVLRAPIGALFLYEHAEGRLGEMFAYRAGIGDIAVGALALVAIALRARRGFVRAWCLVGLVDLLVAVGTAQFLVLGRHDPVMSAAFAQLPFPLLPTLIVPVMITTHLLVLARTSRRGGGGAEGP